MRRGITRLGLALGVATALTAAVGAAAAVPNATVAAATLTAVLVHGMPAGAAAAPGDTLHVVPAPVPPDTLRFAPTAEDSVSPAAAAERRPTWGRADTWLQAPFGEGLLTDLEAWRTRRRGGYQGDGIVDYNRVDQLRMGVNLQYGAVGGTLPRVGGRLEYAFGRERMLYGLQIEQPLIESGRLVVGASTVRRTDHGDLQQTSGVENSLALLFGRQDYRDYFEREGSGIYVQARVLHFSIVSLHARGDRWRSLPADPNTRSWFHMDRPLRSNPAIDEGDSRVVTLRLERLAHRTALTRAGLYHWAQLERAGAGLGGDFTYTRALLDLRGVLRMSPAATLSLRTVAGSTLAGELPRQREFTLGGVDGLRAHRIDHYRGNQMALAQAEYTIGLWRISSDLFEGGLHAIVLADVGHAWDGPSGRWDMLRQPMEADGGIGLSTSEDNVRVYAARNLKRSGADVVVSLRLQRSF